MYLHHMFEYQNPVNPPRFVVVVSHIKFDNKSHEFIVKSHTHMLHVWNMNPHIYPEALT